MDTSDEQDDRRAESDGVDVPESDRRHSRYASGSVTAVGEVASGERISISFVSRIKGGIMGKTGSVVFLASSEVDPEPLKVEDRVGRVTNGVETFDDEEKEVAGCAERGDEPEPPPLPAENDVCKNFGTSLPSRLDDRRDFLFGVMGESRLLDEALVAAGVLLVESAGALAVGTLLSSTELDLGGMIAVDVSIDSFWGALPAAVFGGGAVAVSSCRTGDGGCSLSSLAPYRLQ